MIPSADESVRVNRSVIFEVQQPTSLDKLSKYLHIGHDEDSLNQLRSNVKTISSIDESQI